MPEVQKFLESILTLEEKRLATMDVDDFFMEEFQVNPYGKHLKENVLYKIQETWSYGLLQLFIKNKILSEEVEVQDIIAFETARLLKFIIESQKLDILETKEAWGLMVLNLQRLQESYKNGEAFKKAYLKGRLYYEILFKEAEEARSTRISNYDNLLSTLKKSETTEIFWVTTSLFESLVISENETETLNNEIIYSEDAELNKLYDLLRENKVKLFETLDKMEAEKRNHYLPLLCQNNTLLSIEAYLELPALYPDVSYAYYLRAMYFYHFAWETRGTGIANTVGQKNYANFYERLRYAKSDLKLAHQLSPDEQTYWAELYNIAKHFNSEEADELEEKLIKLIRENAMQNSFCLRRVANMKKARWGGSHQESLAWAREVINASDYGNPVKIMLVEALLEQYDYILTQDRDEEGAKEFLEDVTIQNEVNGYFEEFLESMMKEKDSVYPSLCDWYEKVHDGKRLEKIQRKLKGKP